MPDWSWSFVNTLLGAFVVFLLTRFQARSDSTATSLTSQLRDLKQGQAFAREMLVELKAKTEAHSHEDNLRFNEQTRRTDELLDRFNSLPLRSAVHT